MLSCAQWIHSIVHNEYVQLFTMNTFNCVQWIRSIVHNKYVMYVTEYVQLCKWICSIMYVNEYVQLCT